MRSIHFVHSFSKLSEKFIYDYVRSLKELKVDVRVITFRSINRQERPFEPVLLLKLPWWDVARIWNIAKDKISGQNTETSTWRIYRKKIKEILINEDPDVLHAHFGPMGVLLAPVANELGIPMVVTFYGYDISELLREDFWKNAYKELADKADSVTVLSKEMKERALEAGFREEQTRIIHLGTNIKKIKYKPPSYPLSNFLSIGRLSEKKGHLDTLKAFNKLTYKVDRILHLSIIGDGEYKPKLEAYIRDNNLQDKVSLLGSLPHPEVVEYLYKSDAFILSSKTASNGDREGTPTVLVEAQAAGLPCLSTFHSGIPEVIVPENHKFLAEEGKVSQICSNIYNLITASEEEIKNISRLGRKHVEESFNVYVEAAKFKQLYKELISVSINKSIL